MNAIDLLKSDHQKVSEMIKRLESQDSPTANRPTPEIFEQLKDALHAHTRMEERVFYPALEEKAETRPLVEGSYREHRQAEAILARLDGLKDEPSGDWKARLDELKRSVEHHVAEEETELFPRAEKLLSASELREMFYEMDMALMAAGLLYALGRIADPKCVLARKSLSKTSRRRLRGLHAQPRADE